MGPGAANRGSIAPDALVRRREALARRFADLQWDLGGITYEMASRDHFRLDVLNRHAAELQEVDAELAGVERMLRLGEAAAAGSCPSCGSLYSRGASFCWSCGNPLIADPPTAELPAMAPVAEAPAATAEETALAQPPAPTGAAAFGGSGVNRWINAFSRAVIAIGLLAVTSRRWSPGMLASALGLGLLIGVAFGSVGERFQPLASETIAIDGGSSDPAAQVSADTSGSDSGSSGSDSSDVTSDPLPAAPIYPAPIEDPAPVDPDVPTDDPAPDAPPDDEDPDGSAISGIVVAVNEPAASYALAVRGELYGIHSESLPDAGEKLEVPVLQLTNGSYVEDGERTSDGNAGSSDVNGFVSWVGKVGEQPAYTVSARGASVLIKVPTGAADAKVPELGAFVNVEAEIAEVPAAAERRQQDPTNPNDPVVPTPPADPAAPVDPTAPVGATGCVRDTPPKPVEVKTELLATDFEQEGDPYTYFDLTGLVQAVCPETGEITISADGIRQAGADIQLTVPDDFDLDLVEVDEPVLATAEVGEDGSLTVAGLASDDGAKEADDADLGQGDLAG